VTSTFVLLALPMLALSNPLSASAGRVSPLVPHLRHRAVIRHRGTALYGRRFTALVRSRAVTYG
jgi:hypothetical protein